MMNYYLLLVYPVILLGIAVFGMRVSEKGKFTDKYWGLEDSKKLQALAAVCIIIHHLTQSISEYGRYSRGPISLFNDMGILFTSIFFFFSGYGLITSYLNKENYLDSFLIRRIPAVLFPFLITNIIYAVLNGADRIDGFADIVTSISGFTLINTNAWFVVEIIILYIGFYLCFRFVKNKNLAFILLGVIDIALVMVGFLLHHDHTRINGHWFRGEWWFNTTAIFLMGMIFAKYKKAISGFLEKNYKIVLPIATVLFIGCFSIARYVERAWGYYFERRTYIDYGARGITLAAQIIACAFFVLLLLIIMMKVKLGNKLLSLMSMVSMELYLVHDLVMQRNSNRAGVPPVLTYAIVIVCSYVLAATLHFAVSFIQTIWIDFNNGKFDEYYGVEGRAKNERIKNAIKLIIIFYAIILVLNIGCGIGYAYKVLIFNKNEAATEIALIGKASPGDTVRYGHYVLSKDEVYDKEDFIEWLVLDSRDDMVLLISKDALVGDSYHAYYETVGWSGTTLRWMLNEEFLYEVFTKDEQSYLVADENLGDTIFLLDKNQIFTYFSDAESRMYAPTRLSKRAGGFSVNASSGCASWWIRTDEPEIKCSVVDYYGEIDDDGIYVNVPSIAIRPAMWVKIN